MLLDHGCYGGPAQLIHAPDIHICTRSCAKVNAAQPKHSRRLRYRQSSQPGRAYSPRS
jgi:hypothetical protein